MSQSLISRSEDLKRLRDEGYNIEVRAGYLLVHKIPYVTPSCEVKRGTLVCPLKLAGDVTDAPDNHEMDFIGELPSDADGNPLPGMHHSSQNRQLADGIDANHHFSRKPLAGQPGHPNYLDYHHKMISHANALLGPAQVLEPDATPCTFDVVEDIEEDSVFRYIDSASSRADIGAATEKLKTSRVAIIGLGGTGSYILDFLAKTPVKEIHLFDGDDFLSHNAFRAPGAASLDELRAKPTKVHYLFEQYDAMREGIVVHNEYLSEANVSELQNLEFVFLCLDAGEGKKLAVEQLEAFGVPFIDSGIDVYNLDGSLGGAARVTTSLQDHRSEAQAKISLMGAEGHDEYARNIQVAELNALAASLAVIRWKKHVGYYLDYQSEYDSIYTISGNFLVNEGAVDEG